MGLSIPNAGIFLDKNIDKMLATTYNTPDSFWTGNCARIAHKKTKGGKMPKIRTADRPAERIEKEKAFAKELIEFLPDELTVGYNFYYDPIIREKGFWGVLKAQLWLPVAIFEGGSEVKILSKKWKDALLRAIERYEKEGDKEVSVVLVLNY
jgi:hypothetical protein